jgi:hypothetical protein
MDSSSAFANVNWIAAFVAALSAFVVGALWYGPLFAKRWMRASGMSEERVRQGNPAKIFGTAFVLELVAAVVLAMFIGQEASIGFGAAAGLATGLFWVATAIGVVYLFEQRPLAHWAVNAGYQVVAFLVMGTIIGAF